MPALLQFPIPPGSAFYVAWAFSFIFFKDHVQWGVMTVNSPFFAVWFSVFWQTQSCNQHTVELQNVSISWESSPRLLGSRACLPCHRSDFCPCQSPFPECHVNGREQYVAFRIWPLPLSTVLWRCIRVAYVLLFPLAIADWRWRKGPWATEDRCSLGTGQWRGRFTLEPPERSAALRFFDFNPWDPSWISDL